MSAIKLPTGGKDWMPISPVREHVQALRETGVSMASISRISGISVGTLFNALITEPTKQFPTPRTRILRTTAAAILAVTADALKTGDAPVTPKAIQQAVWVDVEKVRTHIRTLQASGMNLHLIGEQANITSRHLVAILATGSEVEQVAAADRVSRGTARRILAVKPGPTSPQQTIDARPTNRRLQALVAMGYTYAMIGGMLGCKAKTVRPKAIQPEVRVHFAESVSVAYAKYAHREPVYVSDSTRRLGRKLAAGARTKGWLGPLDWDDIEAGLRAQALTPELDDAGAEIDLVDEIAIDLAVADVRSGVLRGSYAKSLTGTERQIAAVRLFAAGMGYRAVSDGLAMGIFTAREIERGMEQDGSLPNDASREVA
ncbi:hypothetical protein GCM10025867_49920 (plasmid) [Frondihabitans sucicola]|uniref:Helix-turn-helix domain-containing protein n=1 Tax=Frondihabitans sucicola TaxID=1268041 RepID=A0ABM8GW88_9MICO|nr:hypothetical protein [Frondihabitans sucicola]BDZ52751.1 hypothetical protein GCM10025867_49920 [Frondihabitans sucicola]